MEEDVVVAVEAEEAESHMRHSRPKPPTRVAQLRLKRQEDVLGDEALVPPGSRELRRRIENAWSSRRCSESSLLRRWGLRCCQVRRQLPLLLRLRATERKKQDGRDRTKSRSPKAGGGRSRPGQTRHTRGVERLHGSTRIRGTEAHVRPDGLRI